MQMNCAQLRLQQVNIKCAGSATDHTCVTRNGVTKFIVYKSSDSKNSQKSPKTFSNRQLLLVASNSHAPKLLDLATFDGRKKAGN